MWTGQTISMLGDAVGGMALTILILQKTGSATAMAMNVVFSVLMASAVGPFAGVVLDRIERRKVLVVCDLGRGVLTLLLGYVIYSGRFSLTFAYSWSIALSLFRAFYDPGTMAVIPSLVKQDLLQRANALQSVGLNTAMVAGPALAGLAVSKLGPWFALAADAASFWISAFCIWLVRPVREVAPRSAAARTPLAELGHGFAFFRRTRLATMLLGLTMVVNFCTGPAGIALSVHVMKTIGGTVEDLGMVNSVAAAASLIGSLAIVSRKRLNRLGYLMAGCILSFGVSRALTGLARTPLLVAAALAVSGFSGPMLQVAVNTLYQRVTPEEMRGRVFALRSTFAQILMPISFALVGPLVDKAGTTVGFLTIGGALILAGSAAIAVPDLRNA